MNDNEILEVEVTPTPTPTPVSVVVEVSPDTVVLQGISDQLVAVSERLEYMETLSEVSNSQTGFVINCAYFSFVLVLFEVLRFVKGLKKKED